MKFSFYVFAYIIQKLLWFLFVVNGDQNEFLILLKPFEISKGSSHLSRTYDNLMKNKSIYFGWIYRKNTHSQN